MSHLINGIDTSSQPLMNKAPLWEVVSPKFKNILKPSYHENRVNSSTWKQQAAISNLCKKLSELQYCMLRRKNAKQIQYHFSKLKSRLHRHLSPQSPSVEKFFRQNPAQHTLNMKQYLDRMPQRINLLQKYNPKFVSTVQTINTTKDIVKGKQRYLQWLDKNNNSPIKSPNYCKMNYVLEKLMQDNQILENGKVGRKRENGAGNMRMTGCDRFDKAVVVFRREQYVAKDRRIRTQGSQIPHIL